MQIFKDSNYSHENWSAFIKNASANPVWRECFSWFRIDFKYYIEAFLTVCVSVTSNLLSGLIACPMWSWMGFGAMTSAKKVWILWNAIWIWSLTIAQRIAILQSNENETISRGRMDGWFSSVSQDLIIFRFHWCSSQNRIREAVVFYSVLRNEIIGVVRRHGNEQAYFEAKSSEPILRQVL